MGGWDGCISAAEARGREGKREGPASERSELIAFVSLSRLSRQDPKA